MKITRSHVLIALLIVTASVWAYVQRLERHDQAVAEPEPYSLIEEGLYQGGRVAEPPPGTRAVLNLTDAADLYECETHRWEPIRDAAPAPDLEWLRTMVRFVEEQRGEGKITYVHCFAGVSRSGMVLVAYEMQKHGWTRDEALAFVRTKRPATNPNPAFMRLLLEWEEELRSGAQR